MENRACCFLSIIAVAGPVVNGFFAAGDELFEKAGNGRAHGGRVLDDAAELGEEIPRGDYGGYQAAPAEHGQLKTEVIADEP